MYIPVPVPEALVFKIPMNLLSDGVSQGIILFQNPGGEPAL